jgi:hypothetical protein
MRLFFGTGEKFNATKTAAPARVIKDQVLAILSVARTGSGNQTKRCIG